jgi:glycogen synthase
MRSVICEKGRGGVAAPVAPEPHARLFTSGEYVAAFQPEADWNPFRALYERKRRLVLGCVPPSARRVLDIGAGPGRMSIPLSEHHLVTSCDLSVAMLRAARPHAGPSLRLCAADAAAPPFRPGTFDAIVCIDVVPHLTAPAATLATLRELLAPDGRLIVDSTNAVPLWTLAYPRYLGRRPSRWVRTWRAGGVPPEWSSRVRHLRRAEFLQILGEAGLRPEAVHRIGPGAATKWHLAVAVAT